jgi:hypothetical protein
MSLILNKYTVPSIRDLIAALDGAMDEDVEKAWLEEAAQRYKELKEGEVDLIPAEDVFSRARTRLKR